MANIKSYNFFIPQNGNNDHNPLIVAARDGDIHAVQMLLHDYSIDDIDNEGRTALFYATSNNHYDVVQLLLKHSSNVNHLDHKGCSVLFYAIGNNCYDITKMLLEYDADINIKGQQGENILSLIILKYITSKHNKQYLDLALASNINLNIQDNEGISALHIVTLKDRLDLLLFLLRHNANPTLEDENNNNFIDISFDKIRKYLSYYTSQKVILFKHPSLIKSFYNAGILNKNIILEYPDLFSGTELNII